MEKGNVILVKAYDFALRILKLHVLLRKKKVVNGLCSQFLRSRRSIGVTTEEAIGAASGKDFIHKMQLAYKEPRETG
jgi:four helix bundle protein